MYVDQRSQKAALLHTRTIAGKQREKIKMEDQILLRKILKKDCSEMARKFDIQGWKKPESQFLAYLEFQELGKRDVIIAEMNKEFAGYLTIKWKSDYLPFREKNIPEIVDFNVLKKFQRRGIGTKLMDEAERRIKQKSKYAGIGFGVYEDYGAAQILYVKRHYIPDGKGIVKDSEPVKYGEEVLIDDSLVFHLVKEL